MSMSTLRYHEKRIFICGKTAPELSRSYYETVCSGGVTEDGATIRLYPVPYRYLEDEVRFRKYQWITARVARDTRDSRPESHRIDPDSIQIDEFIPSDEYEWGNRRDIISRDISWHFDCLEGPGGLFEVQNQRGTSIAFVTPKEIQGIDLYQRPISDQMSFEQKRAELLEKNAYDREQRRFFEELMPPEMKGLDFVRNRVRVNWLCHSAECKGHSMQIMDWEIVELQRRLGDMAALRAAQEHLDLSKYAIRFFLGNMLLHPTRFSIMGVWYPKRAKGLMFV
jgi:hypothetical protein